MELQDGLIVQRVLAGQRQAYAELVRAQADLLVAKYRKGQPVEALAQKLGTTIGALKVRLLRLREALKECVDRQFAVES